MKLHLLIPATILIALCLTGCGGGGGGSAENPSISMSVGADTAPTDFPGVRGDVIPAAPLEAGGRVTVYNFATGQEVGSGVLDTNGMCRIPVTPGITAAVVATGTKAGKNYRLSTIIPVVPIDGGRFIASPLTSMAAEAIALRHFGRTALDQDTFDHVLEKAREFVQLHPDADYSLDGGVICSGEFGQPGCLVESMVQEIIDAVPDEIDSSVVQAKNAVQQIRDIGVPVCSLLNQERPDIERVFAATTAEQYRDLADRLSTLILPAMFGGMEYTDSEGNPIWPTVFDLQIGKGYLLQRMEEGTDDWSNWWYKLSDYPQADTAGQVTIVYTTEAGIIPEGTYTLVAKRTGITWTVTQTFTGDPAQQYVVTIPSPGADPGQNPTLSLGVSLQDAQITTPVSFSGTISATGPDRDSYTSITFDGRLTSAETAASGRFQASFPSDLPNGADPDDSTIYDFPTAFTLSNGSIKVTDGLTAISATGNISATMTTVNRGSGPRAVPKHIEITGTYQNSSTGSKFSGNIVADWSNPPSDLPNADGTFRMAGTITCPERPSYSIDLQGALDGTSATTDVSLHAGNTSLTGQATGTLDSEGHLASSTLTLTNQGNVVFTVSTDEYNHITGTITTGGETAANITRNGDFLRITYRSTPVTYEEFPIGGLL